MSASKRRSPSVRAEHVKKSESEKHKQLARCSGTSHTKKNASHPRLFRLTFFCMLCPNRGGSSLRCRHNIRRLNVCKSSRRISRRLRGKGRLCVKNHSLSGE